MSFYSQKQKGELEENDPSEKRWIVGNPEKKRFQEHLLENSFLEVFEQNISHALQGSSVLIVPDTKKTFVIAFESLGIRKNDEILVPAFCDSVVTSPILRIGAVPIFSDISLNDYALDKDSVEEKISSRTKAIVVAHYFGQPALGSEEILKIAKQRNIPVIEWVAQSFGAKIKIDGEERFVGTLGDVGCLRFILEKPSSHLNIGSLVFREEGSLYGEAGRIRNLKKGDVPPIRRMEDFLRTFQSIDLRNASRKKLAEYYAEQLSHIPQIILPENYPETQRIWSRFVMRTGERDALAHHLSRSAHFHLPSPQMFAAAMNSGYRSEEFPMCDKALSEAIFLPLSGSQTEEDAPELIRSIREFFGK